MTLRKTILLALLMTLPCLAQNPQVPITGNIGANGNFPLFFPRTFQMTSDASATLTYPVTAAFSLRITSSVSLTAQRSIVLPVGLGFTYIVENATTGGQSLQLIGSTGTGVIVPNGSNQMIWSDGTNYFAPNSISGSPVPIQTVLAGPPSGSPGVPSFNANPTITSLALVNPLSWNGNTGLSYGGTAGTVKVGNGLPGDSTGTLDAAILNAGNVNGTSVTATSFMTDSSLTPGNCVQAGTGGLLTTTGSACGAGGGIPTTPTNALVKINGSNGAASAISDNGSAVTITEPTTFSGSGPPISIPASKPTSPSAGTGQFGTDSSGDIVVSENNGAQARICDATNGVCSGGGSSVGQLGSVQVAAASGAFAQGVGDSSFQSVASTPVGNSQGGLQVIANNVVDQSYFQFADGTPCWSAGPAYVSFGCFAEDYTYTLLMNPTRFDGVFGSAAIRNIAGKFLAAADVNGQIPAAINAAGTAASLTYSGGDQNHVFYSGVSMYMVPMMCWEDYKKTGQTTCYTAHVAAIKTAQAFAPINGSSHLPTNVVGVNEWVPQSLFLEQARFSGDVASASVLRAASDAMMAEMATAAGDSSNATIFNTDFTNVTGSIQSSLIDGTSHMLLGATGQDSQPDTLTSGMAVWFSQLTGRSIITLAQQKSIGSFLHTHLAAITYNGYFANVLTTAGAITTWTTQGIIPSGGGGSGYTSDGCASGTYQNGYWSLVTGMNAYALNLTNPTDVPTLLAGFRDAASGSSGDPAWEYYNQAHGNTSSGCTVYPTTATTPNMESPQGGAWAAANVIGPTAVAAGQGGTDKYGAIVTNPSSSGLTNPFVISSPPQVFKCTLIGNNCLTVENDSNLGYSSYNANDNSGAVKLSFGYGNTGVASPGFGGVAYAYAVGVPFCIDTTTGDCFGLTVDTSDNVLVGGLLATSGSNKNSPNLGVLGQYWTGSASASDSWAFKDVLGTGATPTSTLTLTHAGSSGTALVQLPSANVVGGANNTALSTSSSNTANTALLMANSSSGGHTWAPLTIGSAGTSGTIGDFAFLDTTTGIYSFRLHAPSGSGGYNIICSTCMFAWGSGVVEVTLPDTGLSRCTSAANCMAVGNGTAGDTSGTIFASQYSSIEGSPLSGASGTDSFYAASIDHRWHMLNGTTNVSVVGSTGNTPGNCAMYNSNGVDIVSFGSPCGGFSTSVTATPGTGVTSVTCATATCTSLRGTYTVVGGTATTGTIFSLAWTSTPAAYVCTATMNGGVGFLGIGNSVATTTGMNVTAGVTVLGVTFSINYSCQP